MGLRPKTDGEWRKGRMERRVDAWREGMDTCYWLEGCRERGREDERRQGERAELTWGGLNWTLTGGDADTLSRS